MLKPEKERRILQFSKNSKKEPENPSVSEQGELSSSSGGHTRPEKKPLHERLKGLPIVGLGFHCSSTRGLLKT